MPTQIVVVAASSDSPDAVTVQPASFVFTLNKWQDPQEVTVTAATTITHTASGADEYAGIAIPSVTVAVTDDVTEPAAVSVQPVSFIHTEGGDGQSYQVWLDAEATANVTITMTSSNADVNTQPATLTFISSDWQTRQVVTVRSGQDEDQGTDSATISPRSAVATTTA